MIHDITNGKLYFKSVPEYFGMEQRNTKSNTLRVVTQDEYDTIMECLIDMIVITNTDTGESFTREISSIIGMVPPMHGVSVDRGYVLILISWWS